MKFIKIDMEHWLRNEHFEHYLKNVRCSFSLTVNIDITKLYNELKVRGVKIYPAQIYMLTTVVNRFAEFRMSMDENGELGYWEISHPFYTVLNGQTETFSGIYTTYSSDFGVFYADCMRDIDQYATGAFAPQNQVPPNIYTISSLPWLDFTAFNLNVYGKGDYLAPIFTTGKFMKTSDHIFMPLAIQSHHAVCDGLHVGRFVEELRNLAAYPQQWL